MTTTPTDIAAPSASPCMECGHTFTAKKSWQKFCTDGCRDDYHLRRRREVAEPATLAGVAVPETTKESSSEHKPTTIPRGSKLWHVADALRRGEHLDCFAAVRLYHDYVLRSTVSELANGYGVQIERKSKRVPGHGGKLVTCAEYWCEHDARVRLGELLGGDA